MSIDLDQVEYVANLARLDLTPQEKIRFQRELGSIIAYVDQLSQVDTNDVPTALQPPAQGNVLRDDEVSSSLPRDQALANAPGKKDGFFRVPQVIG